MLNHQNITADDCLQYLAEEIFKIQKPSCCQKDGHAWPGGVGLEIEMLPLSQSKERHILLQGKEGSLAAILLEALKPQQQDTSFISSPSGQLLATITMEERDLLSFEPGGQLEFSSRPYPCLLEALDRVEKVQTRLDHALSKHGITLLQCGMNPWETADDVQLQMPKPRYTAMDQYYQRIGLYGRQMMRLTSSIQVCLDFGCDENLMVQRYIAAQMLAPIITAIFAYSPLLAGKPAGVLSYRSKIWRHIDPSHTGLMDLEQLLKNPTREQMIRSYLDFALNADVVYIEAHNYGLAPKGFSFKRWIKEGYQGTFPNLDDFKTHMSLLFPEVRPRGFMEMRFIDAQSRVWQTVPPSLLCGLLYDEQNIHWILGRMEQHAADLNNWLQKSEHGFKDGGLSKHLATELFLRGIEGIKRLPSCFKGSDTDHSLEAFFMQFTAKGRTPAEDLLDAYEHRKTSDSLKIADYRTLEDSWEESK